jgi:hypothetical protein
MAISYPISLLNISAENTATTSKTLSVLSTTAIEGVSTLNEAPYAMSEFNGYIHQTDFGFTDSSSASSNGKHGHNITWSGSIAVPYGTQFPTTCSILPYLNTKGCRIYFNAAFTDWTSVNFTWAGTYTSGGNAGSYSYTSTSGNHTVYKSDLHADGYNWHSGNVGIGPTNNNDSATGSSGGTNAKILPVGFVAYYGNTGTTVYFTTTNLTVTFSR